MTLVFRRRTQIFLLTYLLTYLSICHALQVVNVKRHLSTAHISKPFLACQIALKVTYTIYNFKIFRGRTPDPPLQGEGREGAGQGGRKGREGRGGGEAASKAG